MNDKNELSIKIYGQTLELFNEIKNEYYPDNTDDCVIFMSLIALYQNKIIKAK
jgi:hypothetical protein